MGMSSLEWYDARNKAKQEFYDDRDAAQTEVYEAFLKDLGLDHTEKIWNAFVGVWCDAEEWGIDYMSEFPS